MSAAGRGRQRGSTSVVMMRVAASGRSRRREIKQSLRDYPPNGVVFIQLIVQEASVETARFADQYKVAIKSVAEDTVDRFITRQICIFFVVFIIVDLE